jgi:Putative adhesin
MTTTAPAETPPRAPLSTTARILLFVGLPLLVVAIIVAGVATAVPLLRGTDFSAGYQVPAAEIVRVDVTNARFDITPATDGKVSVRVTGSYTGAKPRITVETADGESTVTGGCVRQWFTLCGLRIAMAVPPTTELVLTSSNGAVAVRGLSGAVDLRTDNGGIRLRDLSGDIRATTTNGSIATSGTTGQQVSVRTTNGNVDLRFATPPQQVEADSTNGGILVRVPDDGADYFLDAQTTNGTVSDQLPSDRTSERTITATTTNGNVTVERAAG